LNGTRFITLLRQLLRGRKRPLHLVLDRLPAHQTNLVMDYVALTDGRLTLRVLPARHPI